MSFPIKDGVLQNDFDCAGFDLLNLGSSSPSGLSGNRLVVTDPAGELLTLGGVTDVEAAYLDGVTSSIQVQLDAKLALAGGTMTGLLVLSGAPTLALHAVTKTYADAIASGLQPKQSVAAATTANITLSGTQTIDAVSIVATRRVLVKDQTDASENGIYVCAAGAWARSTDADVDAEVTAGMYCFVEEGTVNGDQGFVLVTNNPIILDTTNLVFSPFTGAATNTASLGVVKVGADFRLDATYSPTFVALNLSGLTASRALVTDASKNLVSTTVTATELGYLSGVTSALQTQLTARLLLAGGTLTGPLILAATPTVSLEAATKGYVDAFAGATSAIHTPVRAATTANIALSGAQTIDVVSVVAGDRVLVKDQTTGSQNGIYVAASGAWVRAADMDSSGDLVGGMVVAISEGTANGNRLFQLTTNDPMTLATTALAFSEVASSLDPGSSPTLVGLTLSGLTASTVLVANGAKLIASSAVTSTELGWLTGVTSAIQTQIGTKLNLAGGTLTGALVLAGAPTINLNPASKQYVDDLITSGTGTASLGVTKLVNDFRLDTTYSPTFVGATFSGLTASRAVVTDGSKGLMSSSATPTEVDYLVGVTSAIQTQLGARLLLAGGTLSGNLTISALTASTALVADASKVLTSSAVTSTELGYLSGVTSAVQTQLDALKIVGQNSQSTAYTAVLGDANKHLLHPVGDNNARTFTLPANSSVDYPIGTLITFVNQINTLSIACTSDTLTMYPSGATGTRTLAANGQATALKIGATSWTITGVGLT